jgi:thimet oligopeptidase
MIKRKELAQTLGYNSFAEYDINNQMAENPQRAQTFIADLLKRAMPKVMAEKQLLTSDLPESVALNTDGTIKPYDLAYLENHYKHKHFNIDEQKIAEYFPMEKTVAELLDIYRTFFSIEFKEVPVSGLWHHDVTMIQVLSRSGELLGTLILDLYPRPNKYSHAAHTTIIPSVLVSDGSRIPDISIVLANFSKPTASTPSLLKRNEVKTFFHEFGHALHAIMGATTIGSLSGTHTKTDFVELPSQMLEEWLYDKAMLKKVSGHYVTGEPLPDDIIDMIIKTKDLTSGYWTIRQAFLSILALTYFGSSDNTDPYSIMKDLYNTILSPIVSFAPENHFYASFGHLIGYGAKYYGYLWSKVFALDIFSTIKKHGLLDPAIGQKYCNTIIGRGGAQDPNQLLYNFLDRKPSTEAFFSSMGL